MQRLPSQISIIAVLFVFVCYQELRNLQNQMSLSRLRTTSKSAPATQIDIATGNHWDTAWVLVPGSSSS